MVENSLIEFVENAAKVRKDTPLPREYIIDALKKIDNGDVEVERYPMGSPSLKGVYEVALELYEADQTRH